MKYTVKVYVEVEADNADHATALVTKRMESFPLPYTAYQGCVVDTSGVKVSDNLIEYLNEVVQSNDHDTSGWETDLDWCWENADDNDSVSDEVKAELKTLISQVGGDVKVAVLLP